MVSCLEKNVRVHRTRVLRSQKQISITPKSLGKHLGPCIHSSLNLIICKEHKHTIQNILYLITRLRNSPTKLIYFALPKAVAPTNRHIYICTPAIRAHPSQDKHCHQRNNFHALILL